jgi:hypothetical protein
MKRSAVVGSLLAAVVAFALVGAVGAVVDAGSQADQEQQQEGTPMGVEVSSYMQTNSVEAEGEVEDGMFLAALRRAEGPEERRALIERRQERLEQRHQRLQEQRESIRVDDRSTRTLALAARVTVGAADLERSIVDTQRAAEEVGVDTAGLEQLRTNTSRLRGSEISQLAQGVVDPSEREPGANRSENRSNGNGSDDAPGANRSENRSLDPPAIDIPVDEGTPTSTPELIGNGSGENGSGGGPGTPEGPGQGSERAS